MKSRFLLLLALLVMVSCKDNIFTDKIDSEGSIEESKSESKTNIKAEGLADLNWLLGIWENKEDDMLSRDMWRKTDGNTYNGFSFRLYKKDTVFAEKMLLQKIHDDIRLTVITIGQTPGERVSYNLISSKNKEFIFENKSREFPKRIAYKYVSDKSLHTWIEGTVLGENEKMEYRFTRKK